MNKLSNSKLLITGGAGYIGSHMVWALLDAGEDVGLARGLHFLRNNLIDQHFGERARFGRLAVALIRLKKALPIGLGIDENTALVVAPGQRSATILPPFLASRRNCRL